MKDKGNIKLVDKTTLDPFINNSTKKRKRIFRKKSSSFF